MAETTTPIAVIEQWFNQAMRLSDMGRLGEAESIYRRILAQKPDIAEAHHNLGTVLMGQFRLEEAALAFQATLALRPNFPEAWNHLGDSLRQMDRHAPALEAYRRALALRPAYPDAWNNMGILLRQTNRTAEAIEAFRRALSLRRDFALAWNNLAGALKDVGHLGEALTCFDRAIALDPGHTVMQGSRLCTLHYHADYDAPALFREARRWNERFTRPLAAEIVAHHNDPAPQRRLRIGYVSPDFHRHCAALFFPSLLAHHDHQAFEIFCYSGVIVPDAITARLRGYADTWRETQGMSDAQLAQLVRQDQIDILVDLSLHTAGNRLFVFARKPAPIQVSWLGYPGTTGLDTIDYRMTDPRLDPPEAPESNNCIASFPISLQDSQPGFEQPFYSERSVYLPDCFWCYDPAGMEDLPGAAMPEPGPLPALSAGHVTFGCLNNFCKVTDRTLGLWARVLAALPNTRLLLLSPPGPHRARVVERLGVGERVDFIHYQPRRKYLETYRRIDICLDTFPCNGHTTSLDSLWMGVPVLTRVGQTAVGRAGLSQLHCLGLLDLVAQTDDEFVQKAVSWAGDLQRLGALRGSLRQRMERSPLMDDVRFTRNMENAYRRMWRHWALTRQVEPTRPRSL